MMTQSAYHVSRALFTLTRPSERQIRELTDKRRDAPFSYPEVDASREGLPPRRYNIDRYRVRLGFGRATFDSATRAVHAWAMFDLGWVSIFPRTADIEPGAVVAVIVKLSDFGQ